MPDSSTDAMLQSYIDSLLGSPEESDETLSEVQPARNVTKSTSAKTRSAKEGSGVDITPANTPLDEVEAKARDDKIPSTVKPTEVEPAVAPEPDQPKAAASRLDEAPISKVSQAASSAAVKRESSVHRSAPKDRSVPLSSQASLSKPGSSVAALSKASPKLPEEKPVADASTLREEQKARLQKLLSQEALKSASEAPAELKKSVELKQEIAEEFTVDAPDIALPVSDKVEVTADDSTFHDAAAQTLQWHENGRPAWAQERFEVLLFDVAGLTLAVPLVALGQIVRFEKRELTPIFGQSDWFMGLLSSSVGRLRVVNTSLFVMPEKYDERFLETAEYAISLDGVQWALAVNKVNQPISLEPSEIRWRSERSKRAWLAGTVKSHMCALIDIPQMANLLNESDKTLS